jgi:hypothetical protein
VIPNTAVRLPSDFLHGDLRTPDGGQLAVPAGPHDDPRGPAKSCRCAFSHCFFPLWLTRLQRSNALKQAGLTNANSQELANINQYLNMFKRMQMARSGMYICFQDSLGLTVVQPRRKRKRRRNSQAEQSRRLPPNQRSTSPLRTDTARPVHRNRHLLLSPLTRASSTPFVPRSPRGNIFSADLPSPSRSSTQFILLLLPPCPRLLLLL